MKKIIIISLLLSLCTYSSLFAAVLTDAQIGTRIDSIQANVPAGIPSAPTGMDQKGFIGEMLANIFNTQNKIKGFFIEAFVSIWNSQANTLPRWNGQSFIAGTIRDDGTNIAIGTGIVNTTRVNIAGNINISGEYYQDGVLFTPDIPADVVRTFGAQDIGGIKTFLSAMVFENTSPVLNFIDTDTSAQSYITANSISGSIAIVADRSNIVSGSRIMFAVDNTIPKMVITGSGNVGIGVSDPSDQLDVNGKIRMRSQTLATDSPDTVATKKYVDDAVAGNGGDIVFAVIGPSAVAKEYKYGDFILGEHLCPAGLIMADTNDNDKISTIQSNGTTCNINLSGVYKTLGYVSGKSATLSSGNNYTYATLFEKTSFTPSTLPVTYTWITGAWGSCGVSCGLGTQTRTLTCINDITGVSSSASNCSGTTPTTSQSCFKFCSSDD